MPERELSSERQIVAKRRELEKFIGDHGFDGDKLTQDRSTNRQAQARLDELLVRDGGRVVQDLLKIARDDASTLSPQTRAELIHSIMQDLATGEVRQGANATCTAAGFSVELLANKPEEYVRMMSELVTNGKAITIGGKTISFIPGSELGDQRKSEILEPRTISQRIFQVALMQHAVGAEYKYDPATDVSSDHQRVSFRGLYNYQYESLYEDLFGEPVGRVDAVGANAKTASAVVDQILASAAVRGFVGVDLQWGSEGIHTCHFVEVLREEVRDGKSYIVFKNTGGISDDLQANQLIGGATGIGGMGPARLTLDDPGTQSIEREEFERRLNSALIVGAGEFGVTPGANSVLNYAIFARDGSTLQLHTSFDKVPVGEFAKYMGAGNQQDTVDRQDVEKVYGLFTGESTATRQTREARENSINALGEWARRLLARFRGAEAERSLENDGRV